MQDLVCKNCANKFQGSYCNHCGQKVITRLNASFLWHGLRDELLEIDRGLLLTFKELWTHPGLMVAKYIGGDTKKYYSPIKYLIFWSAIVIILFSFVGDNNFNLSSNSKAFSSKSFPEFLESLGSITAFYANFYFFGLVPFLSLAVKLFHRKSGFNFIEIMISNLYLLGQWSFALIFLALLSPLLNSINPLTGIGISVLIAAPIYYVFFKMHKELFSESWTLTVFKALGAVWLSMIIYLPLLYVFVNVLKKITS